MEITHLSLIKVKLAIFTDEIDFYLPVKHSKLS